MQCVIYLWYFCVIGNLYKIKLNKTRASKILVYERGMNIVMAAYFPMPHKGINGFQLYWFIVLAMQKYMKTFKNGFNQLIII